jgi:DNA-binding transcriptional LysR family regulator
MIDIDGIKAFSTVADTKSFSLAAHRLHLTQPAVSKRIALLESQMGVRLFDRIGRTVNLTEAGRELEPRARDILLSIEDTQAIILAFGICQRYLGPTRNAFQKLRLTYILWTLRSHMSKLFKATLS